MQMIYHRCSEECLNLIKCENGRSSIFLLFFVCLTLHCDICDRNVSEHICLFVRVGLYGNDDLHNGLLEVLTAGRKVDNIISMVRNQTYKLENTLNNNIQPQLAELRDIFDGPASNQTALSQLILSLTNVQENVTTATNAANDIRRPLMQVTMTSFLAVNTFLGEQIFLFFRVFFLLKFIIRSIFFSFSIVER